MFDTASEDLMVRCSVVAVTEAVQQLAKRLTGLVAKRPGLVVGIWGEPGIGKTHTVKELLCETPCRNLSLHATTNPTQIARALPCPTKLPVWAERTFERVVKGEQVEIATLTDAIGATLSGLAPFVLHLEDLHEANSAQLEFIEALSKIVLRLKGVGLIVTSREQPPEGFEAIRLEPVSSQAVQEILKAEVSADLPIEALDWIQTRAAGNPLFSLEFFRYLSRQGFVWSDGQKWRWRVPTLEIMPTTVEVLIEHITAKAMLNPTLEIVIQAKALLGRDTALTLWTAVANVTLEILETAKTELEHEGILFGDEFAHPLYAEVIARNLLAEKRQTLARRAIEALEHDPEAAARFVEEANLEHEVALRLLDMATKAANESGNTLSAARFQARAVKYAVGEQKGKVALEAAQKLYFFDQPEATRLAEFASNILTGNTEPIYLLAELFALQGRTTDLAGVLSRLSAEERTGSAYNDRLIPLLSRSGDYHKALELWRTRDQTTLENPNTIQNVAWSLVSLDEYDEAKEITVRALTLPNLNVTHRGQLITILGVICGDLAQYPEAEHWFAQALTLARTIGKPRNVASSLSNHAHALRCLGKYSQMMAEFEEAKTLLGELGDGRGLASLNVSIGEQLHEFGEYERAETALNEGREFLEGVRLSARLVDCEGSLSSLYQQWGSLHGGFLSLKHARTALNYAERLGLPKALAEAMAYMSRAETIYGNPTRGLELAKKVLQITENKGWPAGIAFAQSVHAVALMALDQREAAITEFRVAEASYRSLGLIAEAEKIGLELDRLTNNLESAKVRMQWFEKHGLMNGVNIAHHLFPELATDVPQTTNPTIQTKLEVFGAMQFVTENSSIPVRGQKRRELLALLLEARIAGRKEVARLELLDALYPNSDEMESGASLKDIVYQVREIAGSSSILTSENGYALGEITTDAETFLETGNTQLWRGAYLDGLNLERNNETVRETLHFALRSNANSLLESDPTEAARIGRLLCDFDPYDLEALQLTVKALRAAQNHKTLSRVYIKARDQLLEIGEVLPMHWQDFLENQIGITA